MFANRTEEYNRGKRKEDHHRRPIERAFVTTVTELDSGVEPYVELEPHQSPRTKARVPQPTLGDRRLPGEGDEVYFTRRGDDVAVVLGLVATDHDGYVKERRIDHRHSDAHITIDADGNITAVAADGTSVKLTDGSVTATAADGSEVTLDGSVTATAADGSEVTLDGSVTATAADGTSITVDGGTLQVDGGSTPVVTDIQTTDDGDGHVTSVTPITDDSIQL